jgi:hypothetical protein
MAMTDTEPATLLDRMEQYVPAQTIKWVEKEQQGARALDPIFRADLSSLPEALKLKAEPAIKSANETLSRQRRRLQGPVDLYQRQGLRGRQV